MNVSQSWRSSGVREYNFPLFGFASGTSLILWSHALHSGNHDLFSSEKTSKNSCSSFGTISSSGRFIDSDS